MFGREAQAAIRDGALCVRGSKRNMTDTIFLGLSPPRPPGYEAHDGPVVYTVVGKDMRVWIMATEDGRDAC